MQTFVINLRNCHKRQNDNSINSINYNLAEILKFKKIRYTKLFDNHSSVNESKFLEQYIKIIFDELLDEINGDFKVFHIINDHDRNVSLIQDKLGTAFIFQTDIYKKLEKGDASWSNDLDNITKHSG